MAIRGTQKQFVYTAEGVPPYKVRWDDIVRVTVWRNPHPDGGDDYHSIEIDPLSTTGLSSLFIYDRRAIGSDQDWNECIDVLSQHVPGFTRDVLRRVRRLPDGENAVHVFVREYPEEPGDETGGLSAEDLALHEWLDRQYEIDIVAFRRPTKANAKQRLFADVYNLLAEVQNGGFVQYFGNTTANRLPQTRAALQTIRATAALKHLDLACQAFPRGRPGATQKRRLLQLEAMPDRKTAALDRVDLRFVRVVETVIAKLKRHLEKS